MKDTYYVNKSFNGSITTLDSDRKSSNNETSSRTELVERENWGSPIEFLLACMAYAIGLGNVWRFPYLAFRNGGGAFMIIYLLMVFVIGLPIFFAELFIGQYSGLGPIQAYTYIAPIFQGLGYCTLVIITFVTIYYMVIMAWCIFYLFESFWPVLGWSHCSHDFSTDGCYSVKEDIYCRSNNTNGPSDQIFWKQACTQVNTICSSIGFDGLVGLNASFCFNQTSNLPVPLQSVVERTLSSQEFFDEYVLGLGDSSWTNWGYPRWQLVVCLAIGWIFAYFCLIKGIQSAGKVVYFTAIFPYVILTALLIRAATLDGAGDGMLFYITPQFDRLASGGVWADAASQIFYSFGLGCGSLITFASYNKFNNNCHFQAVSISLINVFTAIYAGFTVFGILGFMAKTADVPISDVVSQGPGLSFVTYPEAVLLMPLPQLWAVLFFLMMLILGIGSQFGGIEAINTAVMDQWPHLREHQWRVTAGTCILSNIWSYLISDPIFCDITKAGRDATEDGVKIGFCFLGGIPLICNGGIFLFTIMEWHTASWAILLIGFAEVIVISWVYGMDRVIDNIHEMGIKFGKVLRRYWWFVWMILSPISSVAVFAFTLTDIGPTQYGDYLFPVWADAMGWTIGALTLLPLIVCAAYRVIKKDPSGWDLFRPTKKWQSQDQAKVIHPIEISTIASGIR